MLAAGSRILVKHYSSDNQWVRKIISQISTRLKLILRLRFWFITFAANSKKLIKRTFSIFTVFKGGQSLFINLNLLVIMYWTLDLAMHLEDAPFPATRDELIDFAIRSGAPLEVIENLQEMEEEGELFESIEDIWPDYPRKDDFLFNEDEY